MALQDIQPILGDPNFQALPEGEKLKVLTREDEDFLGLPREEQLKVLRNNLPKQDLDTTLRPLVFPGSGVTLTDNSLTIPFGGIGNEAAARQEAFGRQNPLSQSIVDVARPSLNLVGGVAGSTPLTSAILTPGAQSVSDLIVGLLGDVRSPEVQRLSQRTLPQYLAERGTESLLGAGAAKLGDAIPSMISGTFRKAATLGSRPQVVEEAAKAADLGINLPLGSATGAPLLTGAEKVLSKSPVTRGKMDDIFENVSKELEDATESKLSKLSPRASPAEAGEQVSQTLKGAHKKGLEANEANYRAIPELFPNPNAQFKVSKQQNKAIELLEEYRKASGANQLPEVIKRLRQASGIDRPISQEVIDALDEKTKKELVEKFVPKKNIKGTVESLSAEQRRVYEMTGDKFKPDVLRQLVGDQVQSVDEINNLIGKPIEDIIGKLSPSSRKAVLESVTPKFDWRTLTLSERNKLNEVVQDLYSRGKNTDASVLNDLVKSLREDMGDIAKSQGPDADYSFRLADREFQEFSRIFTENPRIAKLINATEPEAIARLVTGDESIAFIGDLKKAIGPNSPAFNTIKRKYAEGVLGGGKVGEDTLKAVFSPDEYKAITEFKKTADFVKERIPEKITESWSVKHPFLLSLGIGGVGYVAGGVPGALTTAVIAPKVLSRALLSPSGRALILEGARTPTKSARAAQIATRLTALFAGEEIIEPEVSEEDANLNEAIKRML